MIAVASKWVGRIVSGSMVPMLGYVAAGLVGGAVPANPGWRAPATGVTIYVESNGVHTDIVVPKLAAGIDWRTFAPARDLRDPRYAEYDHLAIGWGEQAFYLETPTWADVRLRTVFAAAIGSERTLMHIEHLPTPGVSDDVRAVVLRPEEYRRLAAFIASSIAPGGQRYPGYDAYDAFYQARGHYNAERTCNAWTGEALRKAGVRVGRWTPFPVTVMGWL